MSCIYSFMVLQVFLIIIWALGWILDWPVKSLHKLGKDAPYCTHDDTSPKDAREDEQSDIYNKAIELIHRICLYCLWKNPLLAQVSLIIDKLQT